MTYQSPITPYFHTKPGKWSQGGDAPADPWDVTITRDNLVSYKNAHLLIEQRIYGSGEEYTLVIGRIVSYKVIEAQSPSTLAVSEVIPIPDREQRKIRPALESLARRHGFKGPVGIRSPVID
jgi:hypothetical protein